MKFRLTPSDFLQSVMTRDPVHPPATSIERTVDGAPYLIRAIGVDDAAREFDFIRNLSPESRYSRLMHAVREPSAAFVAQMVTIDFRHTMAFVAVLIEEKVERIIGVARYADSPDGSLCEFAIVVADEWQSKGVGKRIAGRLIEYAQAQGVHNLHARISATNSRMVGFAHRLGFTTRFTPGDASVLSAQLVLAAQPQPSVGR